MKKLLTGLTICLIALVLVGNANADTTMTFEEFIGNDVTPLGMFYSGITFESLGGGSDWVARDNTTGNYNVHSDDLNLTWNSGAYHINGYVSATTALNNTGNGGKITFDNCDATYFGLNYSASSNFYVEAYNSSGVMIDSTSGGGNINGPADYLQVDWDGTDCIAYVIVHDTGNYWTVDDLRTDATGIIQNNPNVPAPGAILLGGMGVSLVGWLKRRRSL